MIVRKMTKNTLTLSLTRAELRTLLDALDDAADHRELSSGYHPAGSAERRHQEMRAAGYMRWSGRLESAMENHAADHPDARPVPRSRIRRRR